MCYAECASVVLVLLLSWVKDHGTWGLFDINNFLLKCFAREVSC